MLAIIVIVACSLGFVGLGVFLYWFALSPTARRVHAEYRAAYEALNR